MLDPTIVTWIWLAVGILLAISEAFIAGCFIIIPGLAAILVAGIRALAGLESIGISLLLWVILSVVSVIAAVKLTKKHFPSNPIIESSVGENESALDQIVEVASEIPANGEGRIRYQGTTWKAKTLNGNSVSQGQKVKIIDKDNICWIVEAVPELNLTIPVQEPNHAEDKPAGTKSLRV